MRSIALPLAQALEGRTLLSTTPVVSQTVDFSGGFPVHPANLKLNGTVGSVASPPTIVGGHLRMGKAQTGQTRSAFTTTW